MTVRAAAVLPAGGVGLRMGGAAKPFLLLAGEPVLLHALRPFLAEPRVHWIVVALPADYAAAPPGWLTGSDPRITVVAGGAERGDSVAAGLAAVPDAADVVLIHDAARPLLTTALVARCIEAAAAGESVVAAVAVADTIQQVDPGGRIVATPDRASLRRAQTPQAFPRAVIVEAYRRARAQGVRATDDAALVARCGGTVRVIAGEAENIKITEPADLRVAEVLLAGRHA